MKNIFKLSLSVIGCELVGLLGTPFTITAIPTWYAGLNKPFFSPPNWLFGPVWTTLYLLMGISIYLIWTQGTKKKGFKKAVWLFFIQLFLNLIWSPIFFGLKSPELGLLVIIPLLFFIAATIKSFYPLSKTASQLLIPYLLWVSFATVLNAAIAILN